MSTSNFAGDAILFDLEYTAWDGSAERGWSNPGEYREIIQIGAIRIGRAPELEELASFEVLVRPSLNPKLSTYICELTGINQKSVDEHGLPFAEALEGFTRFCRESSNGLFCWGDDFQTLEENCRLSGLALPDFPAGAQDIRPIFRELGLQTEVLSSGAVCKTLGLNFVGKPHNALNDVRNMRLALSYLMTRRPDI